MVIYFMQRSTAMRKCRNWQTSKTKDLVTAMSCGFKSHLPHSVSSICNAGMAELADAYGSGPYGSNTMRVQVSFPASIMERPGLQKSVLFSYDRKFHFLSYKKRRSAEDAHSREK